MFISWQLNNILIFVSSKLDLIWMSEKDDFPIIILKAEIT